MVILYKRGLIYKEVMSDWRVVNTEFYVQVLAVVCRVTPRFRERGSSFLFV